MPRGRIHESSWSARALLSAALVRTGQPSRFSLGVRPSLVLASLVSVASLGASGCYAAHERPLDAGPPPDAPCARLTPPRCVERSDGPCSPWQSTAAVCSGERWVCPPGSMPPRPPPIATGCRLYVDGVPGPHETITPMPIDGRCAWVLDQIERPDGTRVFSPATWAPDDLSACPIAPEWVEGAPESLLALEGAPPGALPQLGEPFSAGGALHVPIRMFVLDPDAPFGVRPDGVWLATLDVARRRFVSPVGAFFEDRLDLGDATATDDGFAYAYGCPGVPDFLVENCIVARAPLERVRDPIAWSPWDGTAFRPGAAMPARVFGSGPWRSSVVRDPRHPGWLHVYAAGFARELRIASAPRPEGPWSADVFLAPCGLPADDPESFCAGPTVHLEYVDLADPTLLVVSHGVGSLGTPGPGDPHRTRLVVARIPSSLP